MRGPDGGLCRACGRWDTDEGPGCFVCCWQSRGHDGPRPGQGGGQLRPGGHSRRLHTEDGRDSAASDGRRPDDGPVKGSRVTQKELDLLLDDYYQSRSWTQQGIPTKKKLQDLNMDDFLLLIEKKVEA